MINNGSEKQEREIILKTKDTGILTTIAETHSSYDPLEYVLMFLNGQQGWQYKTYSLKNSKNFLSPMKFYSYQIQD
jgi:hypothetical protein